MREIDGRMRSDILAERFCFAVATGAGRSAKDEIIVALLHTSNGLVRVVKCTQSVSVLL